MTQRRLDTPDWLKKSRKRWPLDVVILRKNRGENQYHEQCGQMRTLSHWFGSPFLSSLFPETNVDNIISRYPSWPSYSYTRYIKMHIILAAITLLAFPVTVSATTLGHHSTPLTFQSQPDDDDHAGSPTWSRSLRRDTCIFIEINITTHFTFHTIVPDGFCMLCSLVLACF